MVIAGVNKSEKGCRIHPKKRAKKAVGVAAEAHFKALGKIHLIDVAGGDVVADALHRGLVLGM